MQVHVSMDSSGRGGVEATLVILSFYWKGFLLMSRVYSNQPFHLIGTVFPSRERGWDEVGRSLHTCSHFHVTRQVSHPTPVA